jgi:TPR repeat protein
MMVSRVRTYGILMGAAVGTLFLVAAHGAAQDSLSVACADLYSRSPLEDLTRCVEQGHAGAQSALGLKYSSGAGVPEDDVEAVRLYGLAAEQGHAGAQWLLGGMYDEGDGVPENDVLALMWFSLSADQGNGSALESKELLEGGMTRERIAEAERLSHEWIEEHPQDGGN